ncbi:H(+)-transporting V1 sector ATPase subunit F [Recurvomyces mirabilis]|nr:H(+)-transporting V1 sector ATPase subunit F [Recurvomyces mirabilis]
MALPQSAYKDREFLAVIGDEHVTEPPDSQKNFLVVDQRTETSTIEGAFDAFTKKRKDIAIVLINQHVADKIRGQVDAYTEAFPSVLEIPSKDHPYDPEKDSVMKRVRKLFGEY